MRYLVLLIGLVLALAGLQTAFAESKERPRCENCGMFTDISSTHSLASITLNGKTSEHSFVCLECVFNKLEEWGDKATLKSIKVLDYDTAAAKERKYLEVSKAWFLYDTSKLKGSMPVYTAAFSSKKAAEAARKELGGTLMQWTELKPKLLPAGH
ncbi:nitrous oxide reductase accessory protein NosL [bacterium]|nr:nitrous oxide reductase accessory protein NosL [bacterium]